MDEEIKEIKENITLYSPVVAAIVELLKNYIPFYPLTLNIIVSVVLFTIKFFKKQDYTSGSIKKTILDTLTTILGASGSFEAVKHILSLLPNVF